MSDIPHNDSPWQQNGNNFMINPVIINGYR